MNAIEVLVFRFKSGWKQRCGVPIDVETLPHVVGVGESVRRMVADIVATPSCAAIRHSDSDRRVLRVVGAHERAGPGGYYCGKAVPDWRGLEVSIEVHGRRKSATEFLKVLTCCLVVHTGCHFANPNLSAALVRLYLEEINRTFTTTNVNGRSFVIVRV